MPVSVVVPVFRSAGTLDELVNRVGLALVGQEYEVVLVDDGSGDGTWQVAERLATLVPQVRALRLGRNAGQHAALLAGVRAARFPVVVTIDDDLQNPPEEIPRLVDALDLNNVDVVYGVPASVAQVGWRRGSGWLIRRLMKSVLGVDEVSNMSSFRAFRTSLRDAFDVRLGPGVSLDALLAWGTARFSWLEVRHLELLVASAVALRDRHGDRIHDGAPAGHIISGVHHRGRWTSPDGDLRTDPIRERN